MVLGGHSLSLFSGCKTLSIQKCTFAIAGFLGVSPVNPPRPEPAAASVVAPGSPVASGSPGASEQQQEQDEQEQELEQELGQEHEQQEHQGRLNGASTSRLDPVRLRGRAWPAGHHPRHPGTGC